MRQLRYSVAATLDGFIADPKGGYDWIIMDERYRLCRDVHRVRHIRNGAQDVGRIGADRVRRYVRRQGSDRVFENAEDAAAARRDDCQHVARRYGPGAESRSRARTSGCSAAGRCSERWSMPGWSIRSKWRVMPVLLSQGVPLLAPGASHHRNEARQVRNAAEERHRDAVVHHSPRMIARWLSIVFHPFVMVGVMVGVAAAARQAEGKRCAASGS